MPGVRRVFRRRPTVRRPTRRRPTVRRPMFRKKFFRPKLRSTYSKRPTDSAAPNWERFVHGKRKKVSTSFVKKVMDAATPMCVDANKGTGRVSLTSGCSYFCPTVLGSGSDIARVTTEIASNNTTRCMFHRMRVQYQLSNSTTCNVNLRVYDCVTRHDVPYNDSESTQQAISTIISQGFTDAAYTGGVTDTTLTLFQCPRFCENFKIRKVRTYEMRPGEQLNFLLDDPKRHYININRIYSQTGQLLTYVSGVSQFLMFQLWGKPVHDSTSPTQITTSAAAIDGTFEEVYEFKFINPATQSIYAHGSYGTVTTAKEINELTAVSSGIGTT